MNEIKHSPTVVKPLIMDFPAAMKEVINGKKVTKSEWNDSSIVVFLNNGMLCIKYGDKQPSTLSVSEGDMVGEDWMVVDAIHLNENKD